GAELPPYHAWYKPALLIWIGIHLLVPLIYILFFVRWWREERNYPHVSWDRLMLVAVVGLFLFIGIAPAASYLRLCTASCPAFILFVWFARWPGRLERGILRCLWMLALTLMFVETPRAPI